MKKSKKLISLLLSALIVLSSLTVGFYAMAADEETTEPERDAAVVAVEEEIANFYDNHRNNLWATAEDKADAKAAAREAFNKISADLKALSEAQKLEMTESYYAYWLYIVTQDESRNLNTDPTKAARTGDYVDTTVNHLDAITAVVGALPASYQQAYDVMKKATTTVVYTDGDTNYCLQSGGDVNYKDNVTAQQQLDTFREEASKLDADALSFTAFLYAQKNQKDTEGVAQNGFYFYHLNPKNAPSNSYTHSVLEKLLVWTYYEQQDLLGSGVEPASSMPYRDYVVREGSYSEGYTYAWAEGATAQDYIDAANAYIAAFEPDVIVPSNASLEANYSFIDSVTAYDGVVEAVQAAVAAGDAYYAGTITLEQAQNAIALRDGLSETARKAYDYIASSVTELDFAITTSNVYTSADELTPELAYTKYTSVSRQNIYYLMRSLATFVDEYYLNAFIEYMEALDLDALNAEVIAEAKANYEAVGDQKSNIPSDILAKYMQVIKPAKDTYNYEDELKSFVTTPVNKAAINNAYLNAEGGLQTVIDALLPAIAKLVDANGDLGLADGLGKILADNLYTDSIVEAIFDLYATLSHNETDTGVLGMTLGDIIQMIISPDDIAEMLEEEKFAGAVAKIKAIPAVTDEEEAQGINELDKLAAVDFTDADFGFTNGDQQGFIDALLAVLRPITTLLAPDARAAGLIALGVQMCDYVNADNVYTTGVYGNLIPLLEQLGMSSIPTTEEYAANYNAVLEESGENIAADEYLRPIVEALFTDIVDPIADDPLNGLIEFLPRLAYVINGDRLNTYVKSAMAQLGGTLGGLAGSLDLSTAAIDNMITGISLDFSSAEGGLGLVDSTEPIVLTLKPIDWDALQDAAYVNLAESKSNGNAYFVLRTGETESVMVQLLTYLYNVAIADNDNYAAIQSLLNALLGSTVAGLVNNLLLNDLRAANNADSAIGVLLNFLTTNALVGAVITIPALKTVSMNNTAGENGTLDPAGAAVSGAQGGRYAYTVNANDGYVIDTLTVNGEAVEEASGLFHYSALAEVGSGISVTFKSDGTQPEPTVYTITAAAGRGRRQPVLYDYS